VVPYIGYPAMISLFFDSQSPIASEQHSSSRPIGALAELQRNVKINVLEKQHRVRAGGRPEARRDLRIRCPRNSKIRPGDNAWKNQRANPPHTQCVRAGLISSAGSDNSMFARHSPPPVASTKA
jgi:hypothetical protein